MDPIRNPYSPGAGTPPPYLAGRAGLLDAFDTVIGRAQIGNAVQPPVLSGLRGVGKTVLLLRWRELALEAGWAAAHIEARVGTDLRAPQLQLPVLIAGAGLPTVGRVLSDAKSYAERLFDVRTVGRLDDEAQRAAIAEPAAALGVAFEPAALTRLGELAGGYPLFIQTHAKFAWDVAVDSPVLLADVAVAEPRAGEQLEQSFFGPRYERATPAERRYTHALASLGDGPVSTAEAATVLRRRASDVSVQRDGLIAKGLVYAPDRGFIDFTVPHMAAYLRGRTDHPPSDP